MSNSLGLNLSATEVSALGTAREEHVNFFNMSDDEVEDTLLNLVFFNMKVNHLEVFNATLSFDWI